MQPRPLLLVLAGFFLALAAACTTEEGPLLPLTEALSTTSQELQYCNDTCDCPFGSYCASNQCVPDFGPWAPCYCASRDCGPGYNTCSGGFCANTCNDNCDCSYGSYCSGGTCVVDFGPWAPCYCGARDCSGPNQYCAGTNGVGVCAGGTGGGGGGGGGGPIEQN